MLPTHSPLKHPLRSPKYWQSSISAHLAWQSAWVVTPDSAAMLLACMGMTSQLQDAASEGGHKRGGGVGRGSGRQGSASQARGRFLFVVHGGNPAGLTVHKWAARFAATAAGGTAGRQSRQCRVTSCSQVLTWCWSPRQGWTQTQGSSSGGRGGAGHHERRGGSDASSSRVGPPTAHHMRPPAYRAAPAACWQRRAKRLVHSTLRLPHSSGRCAPRGQLHQGE